MKLHIKYLRLTKKITNTKKASHKDILNITILCTLFKILLISYTKKKKISTLKKK